MNIVEKALIALVDVTIRVANSKVSHATAEC